MLNDEHKLILKKYAEYDYEYESIWVVMLEDIQIVDDYYYAGQFYHAKTENNYAFAIIDNHRINMSSIEILANVLQPGMAIGLGLTETNWVEMENIEINYNTIKIKTTIGYSYIISKKLKLWIVNKKIALAPLIRYKKNIIEIIFESQRYYEDGTRKIFKKDCERI